MNTLEDNKYSRWYYSIINKRLKQAPNGYSESHHIKPRSLGGEDIPDNLVLLTAREHYICHLLLTKMVKRDSPDYYKMWKAFGMMAWCKMKNHERDYLINNRLYEKLKIEFSKAQSISQSGSGNSGYGKKWYYNEDLKQSKKFDPKDAPESWKEGRVVNWDRYFKTTIKRECPECLIVFDTKSPRKKFCCEKCKSAHRTFLRSEKPKNPKKLFNIIFTIKCPNCSESFTSKRSNSKFCSRKCKNYYKYHIDPKIVTIERNGESKEVKQQDFPAYRKCGWKVVSQ